MILFNDWKLTSTCDFLAMQYDNLTRKLSVHGDLPAGYDWDMFVSVGPYFDILRLTPDENGASIVLTAQMLAVSGVYTMQLRGTQGDKVQHTNKITVFVPSSMSGDAHWAEIPSEFTELEKRMQQLANTYPTVGENGNWFIAGEDTGVPAKGLTPFIGDNGNWWIGEEDTGVPASGGGHGNVFSNDVSAIRVLTRAEYDAIEKHDETVLYLITG